MTEEEQEAEYEKAMKLRNEQLDAEAKAIREHREAVVKAVTSAKTVADVIAALKIIAYIEE